MAERTPPYVVIVQPDQVQSLLLLGVGLLAGWALGAASRSAKKSGAALSDQTATLPPETGLSTLRNRVFRAGINSAVLNETIGNLGSLQQSIDGSMNLGHQRTFKAAQVTRVQSLYDKSSEISQLQRAIAQDFETQAENLTDIATLNSLAIDLNTTAREIPDSTAGLDKVDNFLGVANKIAGVFVAKGG